MTALDWGFNINKKANEQMEVSATRFSLPKMLSRP
jgi:hypothetical protein